MKDEEVKIGMKVLIPKTKHTGFYPIYKFQTALSIVNVFNKDYLYVIYKHPHPDQDGNTTYSLGINSSSGTSDKINGYGIGGFEFTAEDLVSYDINEELAAIAAGLFSPINSEHRQEVIDKNRLKFADLTKTLPLEDTITNEHTFVAGQDLTDPHTEVEMVKVEDDAVLTDSTLDDDAGIEMALTAKHEYPKDIPASIYSFSSKKDENPEPQLINSKLEEVQPYYEEAPLDKPKSEKEAIEELHRILDENPSIEKEAFNFNDIRAKGKPMEGLRFNEGKLDYTLVDLTALSPMVDVLEFGAKKYSRDNWKIGGEKWGILGILGSLLRHIALLMSGQINDTDSGLPHIGHIQCNAMFLGYFWNKHLKDKKSKKGSKFLKDLPNQK